MSEEVSAFGWGEEITDISDGLPEGVEASGGDASEMGLEFGEGHLDRVEIGTIGRQEEEPGASVGEALGGAAAFVDGEIVEDDDIALRQGRCELGLDVEIECDAIHGLVDDPWCAQPVAAQAGDEALGPPMSERGRGGKPLSAAAAASQPDHFGVDRGLVDEDEPVRLDPHQRLAAYDPETVLLSDVNACAFRRHQRFFYT